VHAHTHVCVRVHAVYVNCRQFGGERENCSLKEAKPVQFEIYQWRTEGEGLGGSNPPPPRNSEILTKYQKLRKFYYMK
jgi:hypothetical protein